MGKDEQAMLEKQLQDIKDDYGPRLERVELEQSEFRKQMEGIKLDNIKVQSGLASVDGTVQGMGRELKTLSDNVSTDGKETRAMLTKAFDHVMEGNNSNSNFKFAQLQTREKVILAIVGGLCGGAGIWAGIAGLIAVI